MIEDIDIILNNAQEAPSEKVSSHSPKNSFLIPNSIKSVRHPQIEIHKNLVKLV